jgi:predicted lipid-binding transport protein (Tim44 family)
MQQWQPPAAGAWIPPDERTPPAPAWQPSPSRPNVKSPTQGLAIASLAAGIIGLLFGWFCAGPIPGIIALVLGFTALSQIKKSPERAGEKPLAIAGIVLGAINVMFFLFWLIWFVLSLVFG